MVLEYQSMLADCQICRNGVRDPMAACYNELIAST